MKTWHYNVMDIIKCPDFKEALFECLEELEGSKDHSIILAMLCNYFNKRNTNFGSNWIDLPESGYRLIVDTTGIYFSIVGNCTKELESSTPKYNKLLFRAIGFSRWVIAFSTTKPPV